MLLGHLRHFGGQLSLIGARETADAFSVSDEHKCVHAAILSILCRDANNLGGVFASQCTHNGIDILAGPTPGGIEVDNDQFVASTGDFIIEFSYSTDHDDVFLWFNS